MFTFDRKPPPFSSATVQRKATISSPADRCEREADEVADKVLRTTEPTPIRSTLEGSRSASVPDAALRAAEGGGEPLPDSLRTYFEPRFGHDFGEVRLHAGDDASSAARAVQARAYTIGHHIVFGRGEYAPDTAGGKRLLAHELTHVVQQAAQPAAGPTLAREPAPDSTPAASCITLDKHDLFGFFGNLYKTEMNKKLAEADKAGRASKTDPFWDKVEIEIEYEDKSRAEYQLWAAELNQAFAKYGICGAYEISLFLGNVFNETRGFQVLTEMKSSFASSTSRFKGRGILQLTTRGNYQAYADYSGNQDVMANPESIATDRHLSVDSAAWFWTERTKIHSNKFKNGGNPKNRVDDIDRIRDIMNPGEKNADGVRPEFAGVRPGILGKSRQIYDYLIKKGAAP